VTSAPRAGLARRLAAVVYETLLLIALLLVANFLLLPLVTPVHAGRALTLPDLAARTLLFCALFVVAGLYFVGSWTGGRRTLAQKTWRLRLVARDGAALDYRRAFLRYATAWIGPALALGSYALLRPHGLGGAAWVLLTVGYLAAFVDPERQFLHDRIAGTRVVQDR